MKLRYYLRGLGIGIIVTLILTGIAGNKKQEMTNEEIKARAAELGMIESTTLSDEPTQIPEVTETVTPTQIPEVAETVTPTQAPEVTETVTPTQAPEVTETVTPTPAPTESAAAEQTDEEQAIAGDESREMVLITIQRGDSSVKVSRMAQEAGLVENAQDFDRYLCASGYDKRLAVGMHEIPTGATYEEIAKILTGR